MSVNLIEDGTRILEAFQTAYEEEGQGIVPEIILSNIKMADDFRKQRNLEGAVTCCEESLDIINDPELLDDRADVRMSPGYTRGFVLMYLGTIYLAYGKQGFQRALYFYSKSRTAFHNHNKNYSEAIARMAQARLHLLRADWCSAMTYYRLCLDAFGASQPPNHALFELQQDLNESFKETETRCREMRSGDVPKLSEIVPPGPNPKPKPEPKPNDFTRSEEIKHTCSTEYNITGIRELVLNAFTVQSLPRFCRDRPIFRPVLDEFGPNSGLNAMADCLIAYCDNRMLFPELLSEIKRLNPRQFARIYPRRQSPEDSSES